MAHVCAFRRAHRHRRGRSHGVLYLPAGDRKFASQLPGAVVVAVAWYLFSLGFHSYVDHVVLFSLYDSLATVVLFLFWLYWLFNILFFGAFVNRQLHEWHAAESPQG